VSFVVSSTHEASGLASISTEAEAVKLLEEMLACHLRVKDASGAVEMSGSPLLLRVVAAREEPTKEQVDAAIRKARKENPSVDPSKIPRPLGKIQTHDGVPVVIPSIDSRTTTRDADSHPLRVTAKGQYTVMHKNDNTSTLWFYLGILVALVLAVSTFRLWPYMLQLGVWYTSVTLLVTILGFYALQGIVFLLFWTVGMEVWVLPKVSAFSIGLGVVPCACVRRRCSTNDTGSPSGSGRWWTLATWAARGCSAC
jgi:hypothetical protein